MAEIDLDERRVLPDVDERILPIGKKISGRDPVPGIAYYRVLPDGDFLKVVGYHYNYGGPVSNEAWLVEEISHKKGAASREVGNGIEATGLEQAEVDEFESYLVSHGFKKEK